MLSAKSLAKVNTKNLSLLDLQKLSLSIQLQQLSAQTKSRNNGRLFLILFGLFVLLNYLNIRLTYNYIYDFWKQSTKKPAFCSVSPSHIVWALAKPWISQLFITNPLDRNTALFLNLVIQERKLAPERDGLLMLCGNPCGETEDKCVQNLQKFTSEPYSQQTWEVAENVLHENLGIPWDAPIVHEFRGKSAAKQEFKQVLSALQMNASSLSSSDRAEQVHRLAILTDLLVNPEPLLVLYTRGLAQLALLRSTYSPLDTFAYLWSDDIIIQPCNSKTVVQQISTVTSQAATWSMVGAGLAAGPQGAVVGMLVGAGLGLAQLFSDQPQTC